MAKNTQQFYIYTLSVGTASLRKRRPRSDAAECDIWSGSTVFATHSAVFNTCDKNLLKFEDKYGEGLECPTI